MALKISARLEAAEIDKIFAGIDQCHLPGAAVGIATATGLQDKFSWVGVAAAGIGAGVGNAVGGSSFGQSLGKYGNQLISGMAGGIAGAAGQSLITGNDFGDTLMASLPSIIGNTIGNIVADKVSAAFDKSDDINSDLVKYTKKEREAMLPGSVRTVDVPSSFSMAALTVPDASMFLQLSPENQSFTDSVRKRLSDPIGAATTGIPATAKYPRIEGLYRTGKTLSGDVAVYFSDHTAVGDRESTLSQMHLINQEADGYKISLKFREASFLESSAYDIFGTDSYKYFGSPVVNVVYIKDFAEQNVLGKEDPASLNLVLTPKSTPNVTVHEVGHRLGLGHSGIRSSVMFPYTTRNETSHYILNPQEIKNIVNSYPEKNNYYI